MTTQGGVSIPPELLGSMDRYAVYRCFSDLGELLYVGSGNFGKRMAEHAQKLWFSQVRGVTVEWFTDELEARLAERRAIHIEHPKYNVQHRNGRLRAAKPRPPRRPSASTLDARARNLLAEDPAMNGGELARHLGVSAGYGRKLRRKLTDHDTQKRQEG